MIEVSHLTKRYGTHVAVSDLSFTVEQGQITGFLGPNGAGKTTTMNIIAGCLGPTEGEVRVDGHSVLDEPMQSRRLVGYLPEVPPLYTEMTPQEYLLFVLRAKGVPRAKRDEQLRAVMDKTQLYEVKDRLIGNLSKGFRQRVGIAQALLGSPKVIILDEPTVGLDPRQIIEIRELIRELGKEHTIVLSSHILSEVQAVCDQIMIISHGLLVASDTADNLERLLSGGATVCVEFRGDESRAREALSGLEGVKSASFEPGEEGATRMTLVPCEGQDVREALFYRFAGANLPILDMHKNRASLEDVFLELTRDDLALTEKQEQSPQEERTDETA